MPVRAARAVREQSTPSRSPARSALAAAIHERDESRRRVTEAEQSNERVAELVAAWEQKLVDANQAARAARDEHAQKIADAAKTNSPLPAIGATRAAITQELEARDALDATHKAAEISSAALQAVQETLKQAEARIAAAVDDVLRAIGLDAMLDEIEDLSNKLMFLRLAHRFFRTNRLYPDGDTEKRGERLCMWEFPQPRGAVEYQHFDGHPKFLDWGIARERLANDPDAPLPGQPHHVGLPLGPDPDAAMKAHNAATHAALASLRARNAEAADAVV